MEGEAKVCLIGDPAVGKTSLLGRYESNKFTSGYIQTAGAQVINVEVMVGPTGAEEKHTLMIWDIVGQREAAALHTLYFQNAKGAVVVCDLTRRETLDHLEDWIKLLFETAGEVPLLFVGNKRDLEDDWEFKWDDLEDLANGYGAPFVLASAKTGENVEALFKLIGNLVLE